MATHASILARELYGLRSLQAVSIASGRVGHDGSDLARTRSDVCKGLFFMMDFVAFTSAVQICVLLNLFSLFCVLITFYQINYLWNDK